MLGDRYSLVLVRNRFQKNRSKGFSLTELLIVVLVIGILAAIALPNFVAARKNALTSQVRGNMRTTQVAAEAYATDSGGVYGVAADIAPYYPGGGNQIGGTAGQRPTNPVTNIRDEATITGGPTTTAEISTLRQQATSSFGSSGKHSYDQAESGASYSIVGCDSSRPSSYVTGSGGKVLVLSNQ